jgi:hypothetical protein
MPLFFFDMDDRDPDQVGVDLPSVNEARNEATRLVSDMAKDHPETLWDRGEWRLTVTDDERLSLFQLVIVTIDAPVSTTAGHTPGTALVRKPDQMAGRSN